MNGLSVPPQSAVAMAEGMTWRSFEPSKRKMGEELSDAGPAVMTFGLKSWP